MESLTIFLTIVPPVLQFFYEMYRERNRYKEVKEKLRLCTTNYLAYEKLEIKFSICNRIIFTASLEWCGKNKGGLML